LPAFWRVLNQLGEPIAAMRIARVRAREIALVSASARPDDFAADVAAGGRGHASAVNHVHARAASFPDLRDHVVRLMNRGE
jgi:hypothetical protein